MSRTPHLLSIQSHVVFGHGNRAAVFPVERLGVNVWPLNTVQFSNHTQYAQWTGEVLPPNQIPTLVEGIAAIGELGNCDAVLSGYLGSAAQGREILEVVARIKRANPRALYLCDPVMGHPEKGCIVAPEVSTFLLEEAAAVADLLCPNQLELNTTSLEDCVHGPGAACTRAEGRAGQAPGLPGRAAENFEMLLASAEGTWLLRRPLLAFPRQPVGVGDLTSGCSWRDCCWATTCSAPSNSAPPPCTRCCWRPRRAAATSWNWYAPRTASPIPGEVRGTAPGLSGNLPPPTAAI